MDIKDLAGLSQPLTRLIDVISHGIGAVYGPYLHRKMTDARVNEIRVISDALKDVAEKHNLPVVYKGGEIEVWQKPEDRTLVLEAKTIDERSNLRLDYQERKRQANIEKVTSVAAAELVAHKSVPDEMPEEDWITRFFGSAQDISSEQMQELWGRVLAGEIKKPGSFNFRTLEFLKNLSSADAQYISTFAQFRLGDWFYAPRDVTGFYEPLGFKFHDFLVLSEMGLLNIQQGLVKIFEKKDTNVLNRFLVDNDKGLFLVGKIDSTTVEFPAYIFTTLGLQIMNLNKAQANLTYLRAVGKEIKPKLAEVKLCSIESQVGDDLMYKEIEDL